MQSIISIVKSLLYARHRYDASSLSPYESDAPHLVRGEVYCKEKKWEVHDVKGREFDEFDAMSFSICVRERKRNKIIGSARISISVGGSALPSQTPLSSGLHLEIGRLAVLPSHRGEGASIILMAAILSCCAALKPDSVHFIALPGLVRKIQSFGIPIKRSGEPIEKNGLRYPCSFNPMNVPRWLLYIARFFSGGAIISMPRAAVHAASHAHTVETKMNMEYPLPSPTAFSSPEPEAPPQSLDLDGETTDPILRAKIFMAFGRIEDARNELKSCILKRNGQPSYAAAEPNLRQTSVLNS